MKLERKYASVSLWIAATFLIALVSGYVRIQAGVIFPSPWNDEVWNIWPAKSFVETGTFLAPELNPERPTSVYGGTYAAMLGIFLRIVGISHENARWFSWLGMAGTWFLTSAMLYRLPMRWLTLGVAGWFFLSATHVVAGNMARPEAMTLFLVTLGFWCLSRGWPIKSIFICGAAVTVHPNALYFLIAAILWSVGSSMRSRLWKPSRGDIVVAGLCVLVTVLSVAHLWRTWPWFYEDFFVESVPYNLAFDPISKLIAFRIWGALFSIALILGVFLKPIVSLWFLYGAVALLAALMGGEMWYSIYKVTGFMVLTTGAIMLTGVMLGRAPVKVQGIPRWGIYAGGVAVAGFVLFMLDFNYRHGFVSGPRNYPQKLTWGWGMQMPDPHVPFVHESDIEMLHSLLLDRLNEGEEIWVEFAHGYSSVHFRDAIPRSARILYPVATDRRGDLVLFHLSRYIPNWVQEGLIQRLENMGGVVSEPDLIRDGTEKWFIVDRRSREAVK